MIPPADSATEVLSARPCAQVAADSRWRFLARPRTKGLLFLASDVVALLISHGMARLAVHRWLGIPADALAPGFYALFFPLFFACLLHVMNGYANADLRRPEKELEVSVKAISVAFLALLAANFILFKSLTFSRYLIVVWYLLALVLLVSGRFALRVAYATLWRCGIARQRALLIGCPEQLLEYRDLLAVQRHQAHEIVGLIPIAAGGDCPAFDFPVFSSLEEWEDIAAREKVQLIVIAQPTSADFHDCLSTMLRRCRELRLDVEVLTDLFRRPGSLFEFDEFSGCFRFSGQPRWSMRLQWSCKRTLDRIVGLLGSGVTVCLMPLIWLFLKLEDGGPLFHRREFVSCDGQVRYYLKFRTMIVNADELLRNDPQLKARFAANHKLADDPRVLRVGRFLRKYSIDEFPQFFSLLSGQLTLVGPRVIAQEEKARYGDFIHKRMSFIPGLTGYWQIMGRQKTSYEERVKMDMFYIDNWSIWLDLVIIAKTFWKVLAAEGAY